MKYRKINAGDKFGKLTVLEFVRKDENYKEFYRCKCDCGNETICEKWNLLSGCVRSCGCLIGKKCKHGETKTRLFNIWSGMKERCSREKHHEYQNYGGRGITVCEEWIDDFLAFKDWAMANGYQEGLTIDRIDVNGNYEPKNCRWVTKKEQNNNRRNNHTLTYNDQTHTISQWSEITGIGKSTILERIKLGWSVEDALTKPVQQRTCGYRPSTPFKEKDND